MEEFTQGIVGSVSVILYSLDPVKNIHPPIFFSISKVGLQQHRVMQSGPDIPLPSDGFQFLLGGSG